MQQQEIILEQRLETENADAKKERRNNRRENLILIFLVVNLFFTVYNNYSQFMTWELLDARAKVQTDSIRANIRAGRTTPGQIAEYKKDWIAAGYDRIAPVEVLDDPDLNFER